MQELEKNIRELLQINEERRRAEQGTQKWKMIFWSVVLLCAPAAAAQAQETWDYSASATSATNNSSGVADYWAWGIIAGLGTLAGLAARARMKRIEAEEARENSCGNYGCIDGGVPFQFAQQQQDTTYIIQQQPFQQQPQRQIIYVQAPAQQQPQPQTEVVYLQAPPTQQQRQQPQRQIIYLPAPQQQPQYGYLTEPPQREIRYLPEGAPYQHPAPQEVHHDPRARQQKQPVRYMPQETYQPDPRGAYPQPPQSYYPGPGADPHIVEYVEEYQPAKYISRGQPPVGQLPAPSASTIDEARRRFEKERNEMK